MDSQPAPAADFAAVIVGGDIGAYSLARAFNERYGVRPYLITQHDTWIVRYSKIVQRVPCPAPTNPEALRVALTTPPLESVTGEGNTTLLLGSSDQAVQAIIALRDKLPDGVIAPYVDRGRLDLGTMKQNFTELCRRLDIGHPATQFPDLSVPPPAELAVPFQFPIMVKPADVTAWSEIGFPGKKKVHEVESAAGFNDLTAAV